ncbi:MAG: carboxypeptidase-like regulatory domain-containing protein [Bacteroidia bacterium]
MKNKILFSLCLTLLLVNSCRKEEISESITGHVYEEGSGNPVPNATVFLIAEGSGSWAPMKQMASAKTDKNGAFAIENKQDPDLSFHNLVAQASDYYLLESYLDKEKYEVTDKTSQMNVYLFRKATIKVRLLNGGEGDNITLQGRRDAIHWTRNLIKDTTLDFNVEAYAPTKINYTAVTASIAKSGDTTFITTPINSDTVVFRY